MIRWLLSRLTYYYSFGAHINNVIRESPWAVPTRNFLSSPHLLFVAVRRNCTFFIRLLWHKNKINIHKKYSLVSTTNQKSNLCTIQRARVCVCQSERGKKKTARGRNENWHISSFCSQTCTCLNTAVQSIRNLHRQKDWQTDRLKRTKVSRNGPQPIRPHHGAIRWSHPGRTRTFRPQGTGRWTWFSSVEAPSKKKSHETLSFPTGLSPTAKGDWGESSMRWLQRE